MARTAACMISPSWMVWLLPSIVGFSRPGVCPPISHSQDELLSSDWWRPIHRRDQLSGGFGRLWMTGIVEQLEPAIGQINAAEHGKRASRPDDGVGQVLDSRIILHDRAIER